MENKQDGKAPFCIGGQARRVAILEVDPTVLDMMYRRLGASGIRFTISSKLPVDAILIGTTYHDATGRIRLMYESAEFDEVGFGSLVPNLPWDTVTIHEEYPESAARNGVGGTEHLWPYPLYDPKTGVVTHKTT